MAAVKKSVSVKDVARLAGVSEQTVSRTVHDSPSVFCIAVLAKMWYT